MFQRFHVIIIALAAITTFAIIALRVPQCKLVWLGVLRVVVVWIHCHMCVHVAAHKGLVSGCEHAISS